jgi:hypothetical protein
MIIMHLTIYFIHEINVLKLFLKEAKSKQSFLEEKENKFSKVTVASL